MDADWAINVHIIKVFKLSVCLFDCDKQCHANTAQCRHGTVSIRHIRLCRCTGTVTCFGRALWLVGLLESLSFFTRWPQKTAHFHLIEVKLI